MAKQRIQILLDEDAQTTLTVLQEATGARSMAEVLRDALGVYNSLHEMLSEPGKCLALVNREAGEMQELFIPSLMRSAAPLVKLGPCELAPESKRRR